MRRMAGPHRSRSANLSARLPFVAGAAACAAACTVGPNYHRPDAPAPPAYAELAGKDKGAPLSRTTSDAPAVEAWWTQFHDPELDSLVARALHDDLDLEEAASRIRQARASEVVAQAAGLPQVNATSNSLRVNRSSTADSPIQLGGSGGASGGGAAAGGASGAAAGGAAGGGSSASSGPSHINYFTAGLDAIWEVDVFGGVRRSVENARDLTAAQVWSRRDSQVSVASEVANQYLTYRQDQARIAVLKANVKSQEGVLGIIGDRFRTGFVTNIDVNQQRAQLANTQAQIPQVEAASIAAVHALGLLLNRPPADLQAELAPARDLPPVPPTLPAGMPSDLLRRRPDIRAAERRLAAANAQIGVQTAVLYPSVNLVGLGTFGSSEIENLFDGRNATSLALGLLQYSVFNGGQNQANIRIAKEQYLQSQVQYRRSVLTALREVEDALARYSSDQRRQQALDGSAKASRESVQIATEQYEVGRVDYTTVYNAEVSLEQTQDQLVQANGALGTDIVALYKALGGGWTADPALDGKTGADYPRDRGQPKPAG